MSIFLGKLLSAYLCYVGPLEMMKEIPKCAENKK